MSALTPSLSSKTACVALSQDTITWRDVGLKFLNSLPDSKSNLWDSIKALLDKYIPPTFEFISAALLESEDDGVHTKPSAVSIDNADASALEAQELKLTEVHLMNSCCKLFQVALLM